MRTLILLSLVVIVAACDDGYEFKPKPDPILGNWSFKSGELEFDFDMIHEHVYKGVNSRIKHPSLTTQQQMDNFVVTYNKTVDGWDMLRIRSHSPIYQSIWLRGVTYQGDKMLVESIEVSLPGTEFTLENQVMLKNARTK